MHITLHGRNNIQCEARLSEPALVVVSPMQHPASPTAAHHHLPEHHGKHCFNCEQTSQQTDLSKCRVAITTLGYQSVSYCRPPRSRPQSKPPSSAQPQLAASGASTNRRRNILKNLVQTVSTPVDDQARAIYVLRNVCSVQERCSDV